MALLERSVAEQRYEAVMQVLRHKIPVSEVAARFGVSRQSVHTWVRRYEAHGLVGLVDRSHRPQGCPHQTAVEVEAKVCELRRAHPKWGPQRLLHELERRGVEPVPSRSAIYRLLVRRGLIEPRSQRQRHTKRWERDAAMQLWQVDVMGGVFLVDGSEVKVVTGIDDHSRFCVLATVVPRPTARAVCSAFAGAMRRYGVPEEVLTDNGKQFTGRFNKPRPAEVLFERILRETASPSGSPDRPRRPPRARSSGSTRPCARGCSTTPARSRMWRRRRPRSTRS
jgi:transposase-like protein